MSLPTPTPTQPIVKKTKRWNIVWVMPILALLIGTWLLYQNFATSGPIATITFETAEGIKAGQTEIRCRSVKVGVVKEVKLSDDLNSVMVVVELKEGADALLTENTQFWVVKPRLSAAEISGLGTLIQGVYIELDPGQNGGKRRDAFQGLETPPATNSNVPGRRIVLVAEEAGALQVGAPIYYRGFEVGRIESRELSDDGQQVSYEAFIEDEHSHLLTENCRFWNSSGLEIDVGASGVVVKTPSLESMISGGVSFGLAEGMVGPGDSCVDGHAFKLFPDEGAARRSTFTPTLTFLLLFDQTVRGLTVDSPVEFRGIPIGRISKISFELVDSHDDPRIPVLIDIDPSLCRPKSDDVTVRPDTTFFIEEIDKGLRAGLKTTSLITGAMHIDFDYHSGAKPAKIGKVGRYATFPTVATGLAQLEPKLNNIMDQVDKVVAKIEKLDIDKVMDAIAEAADEGKDMAAAAREVFEDPKFKELPKEIAGTMEEIKKAIATLGPEGEINQDIDKTLADLRAALASIKAVADLLEEKPNALIFGKGREKKEGEEEDDDASGPRSKR